MTLPVPRATGLLRDYLVRTGQITASTSHDAPFQYEIEVLGQMLVHLDAVMQDEHVPSDVAVRILRGLIYGAMPSAADARLRMAQGERLADALAKIPVGHGP